MFLFALRGGYRRISQRIYQRHGKIVADIARAFIWSQTHSSLALFIFTLFFAQKALAVDIFHCNSICI